MRNYPKGEQLHHVAKNGFDLKWSLTDWFAISLKQEISAQFNVQKEDGRQGKNSFVQLVFMLFLHEGDVEVKVKANLI